MRDLLIIAPTMRSADLLATRLFREGAIESYQRVDYTTPCSAFRKLEGRRDVVIIPWRYEDWNSCINQCISETWDAIIRGQMMTGKIDIFWLHESDFA